MATLLNLMCLNEWKSCLTVKQGIYILLGVIAEVYPEYMVTYADRLTGLYVNAIKMEVHVHFVGCYHQSAVGHTLKL